MISKRRLSSVLAMCVIGTLAICSGCKSSQNAAKTAATASSTTVFVVFEGPWAFVTEPGGDILAVAPKAKNHYGSYLQAAHGTLLPFGDYRLAVDNRTTLLEAFPLPTTVGDTIASGALSTVVGQKVRGYVIRLPKPDGAAEAAGSESTVAYPWPPDPGKHKTYTVAMTFLYAVSDLKAFHISGTPDTAGDVFPDFMIDLGVPRVIKFAIEPEPGPQPDPCDNQSKQAFKDLVDLFSLKQAIDFPPYDKNCQDEDPQNPHHPVVTKDVVKKFTAIRAYVQTTRGPEQAKARALADLQDLIGSASGKSKPLRMTEVLAKLLNIESYLEAVTVKEEDKGRHDQIVSLLKGIIADSRHRTGVDCKAASVMLGVS